MTLPPVNEDEAHAAPFELPSLDACDRATCLELFAHHLYGSIPPPPDRLTVERRPLAGLDHLAIGLRVEARRLEVDAALWLPAPAQRPAPVIIALDFLGPIGIEETGTFPLDHHAVIDLRGERTPAPHLRGRSAERWPIELIRDAGFGLLLACYGSWTHDDPASWRRHGIAPLVQASPATGAISLWAWALLRLVDVACRCPEIDANRLFLAGHSRLGKAALWAAASDARVAGCIANSAGCAGAALSRRNFGETLAHLTSRYPHWLTPALADTPDPLALPVDQHQLLACIAPRRLYVASAAQDLWADPRGEYLALQAAAPAWGLTIPPPETVWRPGAELVQGAIAWHLRPGAHDLTPWDWRRFLPHLARQAEPPAASP